mmetsp:Transcript_120994/g.353528  ORF Transcript_120994/g.353528 Transcript_120994/m.353528 type:complete len:475 (-) Transcript_120994:87-1511(-)
MAMRCVAGAAAFLLACAERHFNCQGFAQCGEPAGSCSASAQSRQLGTADAMVVEEGTAWQSLMQVYAPVMVRRKTKDWQAIVNASEYNLPRNTTVGRAAASSATAAPAEYVEPTIVSTIMEAITRVASLHLDPFGHTDSGSEGKGNNHSGFFRSAPINDWIILVITSIALFLLDFVIFQRHFTDGFKSHVMVAIFWIFMAFLFNLVVGIRMGYSYGLDWCSGYVLEWLLSLDNLFVFHLIFDVYKTPANQVHKAVFIGVIGAVLIRMVFFLAVSELLRYFGWVRFPFGVLLVWSGVQAAMTDDEDTNVEDTFLVKGLTWLLGSRLKREYDKDGRMVVFDADGRLQVTLLAMVVACLELSDVVFALDSVSAKVAQISNDYIAFSSSVLAMYGLRSAFFIVKDLIEMFDLLQYGLSIILVFIGLELMLSHYIHLASGTVCILILSVVFLCIAASTVSKRLRSPYRQEFENAMENSG